MKANKPLQRQFAPRCKKTLLRTVLTLAAVTGMFAILQAPGMAQEPKPDPAGITTGDKTNVVDAGGNSFVVTEPTDKNSPDYAKNKKSFDEFKEFFAEKPGISGGFALMHWAGSAEDEDRLSKEFKTTVRNIPLVDEYDGPGKCIITGETVDRRAVIAKAY